MANNATDKTPNSNIPYSLEAEEALLGAMIVNPASYPVVAGFLKAEDFFFIRHVPIWQAIGKLSDANVTIDYITLAQKLQDMKQLEFIGGPAYLTQLITSAPSSQNAEVYGRLIEVASMRRNLIKSADEIKALAYNQELTLDEVMAGTEESLNPTRMQVGGSDDEPIVDLLNDYLDTLEARMKAPNAVVGISSGLNDLDNITLGWTSPDLVTVAGRPGMGKTALALGFAYEALKQGKHIAFFSMEMGSNQLLERLISRIAGVTVAQQKTGKMNASEFSKVMSATGEISKYGEQLFLCDHPSLTPAKLRAKCLQRKAKHGLDMIIIDYMQLMSGNGKHSNRTSEIGEISRALKNLAMELGIPVIALAQLSRAVESRQDKRPMLSDLRDSGTIEQDSDEVIFVYRDSVYNEASESPNTAELLVSKNRDGRMGVASVYFDSKTMSFMNGVQRNIDLSTANVAG